MAITFVSSSTSGTTDTISAPSAIVAGNLLIAILYRDTTAYNIASTPFWGATPDWTFVGAQGGVIGVFYKYATSSEPTSYSFTAASGVLRSSLILQYSGTSTALPLTQVTCGGTGAITSSTTFSTPSLTCAAGEVYLAVVGEYDGRGATVSTAGFASRAEYKNSGSQGIAAFDYSATASGAVSASGTSTSGVADYFATFALKVRPAGANQPGGSAALSASSTTASSATGFLARGPINAVSSSGSLATTLTSLPSGLVKGNLLVATTYYYGNSYTPSTPPGWAHAYSFVGTSHHRLEVYYKYVTGNETAPISFQTTTTTMVHLCVQYGSTSNPPSLDATTIASLDRNVSEMYSTAPGVTSRFTAGQVLSIFGSYDGYEFVPTSLAPSNQLRKVITQNNNGIVGATILDSPISATGATGQQNTSQHNQGSQVYISDYGFGTSILLYVPTAAATASFGASGVLSATSKALSIKALFSGTGTLSATSSVLSGTITGGANFSATGALASSNVQVTQSIVGYPAAVLADSPTAYWRFKETSGTAAADDSGHSNAGTYTGAYTLNQAGPLTGQTTTAALFSGGDMSVPAAIPNAGASISIEFWLKRTTTGDNNAAFRWDNGTNRVLSAHLPYSNTIYFDAGLGTTSTQYDRINKAVDFTLTAWHHYVFVKDVAAGTMSIYIDGALWLSATGKTQALGTPTAGYVSGQASDVVNMQGYLAEFAVYPKALTSSQVQTHYNSGITAPTVTANGAAALSSTSSLTITASSSTISASAAFSSTSSMVSAGYRTTNGASTFPVASALVSSASTTVNGSSALSAAPSLTSGAYGTANGVTALAATSGMLIGAEALTSATSLLTVDETLTVAGTVVLLGSAPLASNSTLALATSATTTYVGFPANPGATQQSDTSAVTLGTKFRVTQDCSLVTARVYVDESLSSVTTSLPWALYAVGGNGYATGSPLVSGTFPAPAPNGSPGWQEQALGTPYPLTINVDYVLAVYFDGGYYSAVSNYFTSDIVNGPLVLPATSNGQYHYASGISPTDGTFNAAWYGVDVAVSPTVQDVFVTELGVAPLTASAALTATASDLSIVSGSVSLWGTSSLTFPAATYTGFTASDSSKLLQDSDASHITVGTKFRVTQAGYSLVKARVYLDFTAFDHLVGNPLHWSLYGVDGTGFASGTVLVDGYFNDPGIDGKVSGWYESSLVSAYPLITNAEYVLAVYFSSGYYSAVSNYITADRVNGPLTIPAGNNGQYVYGSDAAPNSSFNQAWYGVDVAVGLTDVLLSSAASLSATSITSSIGLAALASTSTLSAGAASASTITATADLSSTSTIPDAGIVTKIAATTLTSASSLLTTGVKGPVGSITASAVSSASVNSSNNVLVNVSLLAGSTAFQTAVDTIPGVANLLTSSSILDSALNIVIASVEMSSTSSNSGGSLVESLGVVPLTVQPQLLTDTYLETFADTSLGVISELGSISYLTTYSDGSLFEVSALSVPGLVFPRTPDVRHPNLILEGNGSGITLMTNASGLNLKGNGAGLTITPNGADIQLGGNDNNLELR